MKTFPVALIASSLTLAFIAASPAEAAKTSKHKKSRTTHATLQRQVAAAPGSQFQGGVLKGPLYNGPEYLGNDPDPNIRAYMLRDLSSRYGGGAD
jgi:hypothetical protein